MEAISVFVKETLPRYLSTLPVPDSFGGFSNLKGPELVSLGIFFIAVGIVFCALLKLVLPSSPRKPPINLEVKKEKLKVVDLLEIEDFAQEKVSYCRCWKSCRFPICDGSHNKHNEETGDNVGPLVIKRKERQ